MQAGVPKYAFGFEGSEKMKKIIPLNSEQIRLVNENIQVVKRVIDSKINVYENILGLGFQDVYQEGCLWLCCAARKYDKALGVPFERFAFKVVLNGLLSYCKAAYAKEKRLLAFSDEEIIGRSNLNYLFSAKYSVEQMTDESEILNRLGILKKQYSGTVRLGIEALELKMKGYNGSEIAKLYGVKPNLVGAWISRAKKKLGKNSLTDFKQVSQNFKEGVNYGEIIYYGGNFQAKKRGTK